MYRSEQEMISRIMQHEMLLERTEQVIGQMETALDAFEGIRRDMQILEGLLYQSGMEKRLCCR